MGLTEQEQKELEQLKSEIAAEEQSTQKKNVIQRMDESIGNAMQKIEPAFNFNLVPEELSRVGETIRKNLPEGVGENLADTAKKYVFPAFPPNISQAVVDQPVETLANTAMAVPVGNAIKAGQTLKAVGALTGGIVGGQAAANVLPEGYKNVGAIAAGVVGSMIGMGAGALAQKPVRFIEKAITSSSKTQLINAISNNADDIASSVVNNDLLLDELYDDVYKPYNKDLTNVTVDDIVAGMDDASRKEVIPVLRKARRLSKQTQTSLVDAEGKYISRPLAVEELKFFMQELQEEINARTYSPQPKDTSVLSATRKSVKDSLRKSLPEAAQKELGSLDKAYGSIKPKTKKILKKVGWSYKDKTIDTTKLDELLSSQGDITAKSILNELMELDEAMKPAVRDYTRRMTRYKKYLEPKPPKQNIIKSAVKTAARVAVPGRF